ncbi:UNVERIFIED_CONTAM: hypothetical protein Sindi_3058600, partial [Sesamum indicum]
AYITALPLDTYRNDNGSSRRDLLLNSQNFCRSIPRRGREPVAVSAVLPEALGKSE